MKYGLTRKLNAYSIEKKNGVEVIATAGDYMQSQLWCSKHLEPMEQMLADLYQTFAWAWFALRRNGELKTFGLPEKLSSQADIEAMAGDVTVFMEMVEDDSLPLDGAAERSKK